MAEKLPITVTENEFRDMLKAIPIMTKDAKRVNPKELKLAFLLGFFQCMRISEVVGLKKQVSRCCWDTVITVKKTKDREGYRYCAKCKKHLTTSNVRRSLTEWDIPPLMPDCINLDTGFIRVQQGKGKKDRDIPIMPLLKDKRLKSMLPLKINRRTLQVWVSKIGYDITRRNVHFHTLRASGATMYLNERKVNLRAIQQLLGHSRISTTELYTRVSPSDLKKEFDDVWS